MSFIQTQLTVSIHELVSWTLVIIGLMLWLHERKKNDNTKHYMVIQGILQNLKEKANYAAHLTGQIDSNNITPTKEQFIMLSNSIYTDQRATMQSLMGVLKSFELKKDMPFDIEQFLKKENDQSQDQ
ncbi:hypothetical protein LCGC14_2736210 [marine sediment metagenome]|uniref:Uncharacterized protein n=1 Tax=marine sediment metagenome TaxID=412755 RepID=A0A0F8Z5T6_9ZZZZ|nr:hypothetical protein [Desulfobacterales bacterium]